MSLGLIPKMASQINGSFYILHISNVSHYGSIVGKSCIKSNIYLLSNVLAL